jgi:hypothetical protein
MNRVFSNGPSKDFVINPFQSMARKSSRLWVAAPYVTMTQDLLEGALNGKSVYLLVGLNVSTSPDALAKVHGIPNCEVRYFTRRFHAKIYLFDNEALVGSSNLTDGGLKSNREAMIWVDQPDDLDELRALFNELWTSALVLTTEKLKSFTEKYESLKGARRDLDTYIEDAVGKAEPANINVESRKVSAEGIFVESLRRQVQQYRAAFTEVSKVLEDHKFRRPELEDAGSSIEANRFLNWVRLTYAPGEESWEGAPLRPQGERQAEVFRLGREWTGTEHNKIPEDFLDWLRLVRSIFGTPDAIDAASKEQLTEGLLSIHAFNEQLRFVKGGKANLPIAFWSANNQDVTKAKRTLRYLVHGGGDFIGRLHDMLYDPAMKLGYFGMFCALELYGTIKPEDCPPINGRMAKALRYLGFDVRGT